MYCTNIGGHAPPILKLVGRERDTVPQPPRPTHSGLIRWFHNKFTKKTKRKNTVVLHKYQWGIPRQYLSSGCGWDRRGQAPNPVLTRWFYTKFAMNTKRKNTVTKYCTNIGGHTPPILKLVSGEGDRVTQRPLPPTHANTVSLKQRYTEHKRKNTVLKYCIYYSYYHSAYCYYFIQTNTKQCQTHQPQMKWQSPDNENTLTRSPFHVKANGSPSIWRENIFYTGIVRSL